MSKSEVYDFFGISFTYLLWQFEILKKPAISDALKILQNVLFYLEGNSYLA